VSHKKFRWYNIIDRDERERERESIPEARE
jgi:hypothetical protein